MRRAWRKLSSGDDAGYSLVDLLVGMSVMSVLMVVILSAIADTYSNVTRTENTSFAREQVGNSFRRLDKELRYATWISAAEKDGTNWYLPYASPAAKDPVTNKTSTDFCRQLKFSDGVLSLMRWDSVTGTQDTSTQIATDLSLNAAGAAPFTVINPNSTIYSSSYAVAGVGRNFAPDFYQVRLQFNAALGRVSLPLDVVFTAQNLSGNSSTSSDCSKWRYR